MKKSRVKITKGTLETKTVNEALVLKIKAKRKKQPTVDNLVRHILKEDITALSRAITILESKKETDFVKANSIVKHCLPHSGKSIRIGITGVPGVGKSTFIEALGTYLTTKKQKVAILAIDPSSSLTRGSILGDKTRMENLAKQNNIFIRPSPSGETLGGVARKTRETIILCEAAGFTIIIVETVGVGQSETAVHSMVDFFLLLKLSGAGDELQGIKRGIIEMADAIVINKADNNNEIKAKTAKMAFQKALHLYPKKITNWQPIVTTCSALNNIGIEAIWAIIMDYKQLTQKNLFFEKKRTEQNTFWVLQTIEQELKTTFFNRSEIKKALKEQLLLVQQKKISPFVAAHYLLNLKTE